MVITQNGTAKAELIAEKKLFREKTSKPLLWLSIVSIVMMFAGLTSGYLVIQKDAFWVHADLPWQFWISTVVILLSSFTMYRSVQSARKNDSKGIRTNLIFTLILGLGFAASQYIAWDSLVKQGQFFSGKISAIKGEYGKDYTIQFMGVDMIYENGNLYSAKDIDHTRPMNDKVDSSFNTASGFLYVLSGLHLVHLFAGIIFLSIVTFLSGKNKYSSGNLLDLELCSIYWHFLDGLWIYLFLFLIFIH